MAWAIWRAHGLGYLLTEKGKFHTLAQFWPVFIPSLTAMIGFWATLSLNMPDFTRFGRSQREQAIGQVVALPTTMTLFAAMGVIITSAAIVIYPGCRSRSGIRSSWSDISRAARGRDLDVHGRRRDAGGQHRRERRLPANDFANAFPKLISFRTGGLITGIVGILMQPWKLLADPTGYIFQWLLGYSGGLGSIAGVLIVDYWIVRRKQLAARRSLPPARRVHVQRRLELARRHRDARRLRAGVDRPRRPSLRPLYDYAWFVGFGVAAIAHFVLMKVVPPEAAAAAASAKFPSRRPKRRMGPGFSGLAFTAAAAEPPPKRCGRSCARCTISFFVVSATLRTTIKTGRRPFTGSLSRRSLVGMSKAG